MKTPTQNTPYSLTACLTTSLTPVITSALFFLLVLTGCKKSGEGNNCELIPQVKIIGAKATTYYVGDTIWLKTNISPLGLYSWSSTTAPNDISNSDYVLIPSCSKYDQGWYYLAVSYPDCASHFDSVYITVTNKSVPPPCSPASNSVSFSSIPSISFGSSNWGIDPSWGLKDLSANPPAGYPDFNIYFNPYWNDKDPEDGAYNISPTISFDQNDLYTVYMNSTYESVFFEAGQGQVFVSHSATGKLQVTFCTISFSGSLGGPGYTTTASGMLTAP